jgi:nucleoid DNA-binding protein
MALARRSTSRKTTGTKLAARTPKKAATKSASKTKIAKTAKPTAKLSGDIQTKTELFTTIGEHCELSKKQVSQVFECLENIINHQVKKGGAGVFTLPGLCKIMVQEKAAVPARKGINPFTGEPTTFKAKPKRRVIKIRPLKKLKDMAL